MPRYFDKLRDRLRILWNHWWVLPRMQAGKYPRGRAPGHSEAVGLSHGAMSFSGEHSARIVRKGAKRE